VKLPSPFALWEEHVRVEVGGAQALFTTRRGGVSSGPYTSLNLGRLTDDRPDDVNRNRTRVQELINRPLASIRQVHGTRVKLLTAPPPSIGAVEEADGQATTRRDIAPTVLVADCLPIVLAGGGGVAVLHAGWRGLAGAIVDEGVAALRQIGCDEQLEAAIGPGARGCCYEVGEEVHRRFAAYGSQARRGANLDLAAVACAQLRAAGVSTVHDVGLCTICGDPEWFFSHRRDGGVTGRQAGVAWLS
jgi:hypothetical protein